MRYTGICAPRKRSSPLQEMAVMGVAWLVGIEFVARKQHEIDPALDRRINHAVVRLRNRARKPVSPFRRKITQAAKRRTQMDVARMNECNTVGHTPSLAQQTKKCRGVQTSSAKKHAGQLFRTEKSLFSQKLHSHQSQRARLPASAIRALPWRSVLRYASRRISPKRAARSLRSVESLRRS